jgi:hypothetical protein
MEGLWKRSWQVVLVLLATASLGVAETTTMPPPGTLNYVEGQVAANGHSQSPKSVGSTMLEAGQVLDTHNGYAELLLTPGVFLRVGHNSEVKMISPGLTNTEVAIANGSATVELDQLFKENNLDVVVDGATTRIEKKGLYDFNANQPSVSVLDGKARVSENDRQVTLKKGHEVLLASSRPLKARKLDKKLIESDPLYRWSELRSKYTSEASVETANTVVVNGGWYGPGWYWDPFWGFWSFLPGDGILWGPFGWGFFSPGWVGWAPYYGYHGAYYHYPHHPMRLGRGYGNLRMLARRAGPGAAGFHGAARAMGFARLGGSRMGSSMGSFHGGFAHRR